MAMFPALMNDMMFSDLFDDPFFASWRGDRNARPSGSDMTPMGGMNGMMTTNMMNTDVRDMGDSYKVDIDMPGFTKDQINVELKDGYLTVSAHNGCDSGNCANDSNANGGDAKSEHADSETCQSQNADEGKWLRRERYYGSCSRSFYVGEDMKESDIHAKFENGTLTLTLPKQDAQPAVEQKHTIAIEG
ncbi:Hsp20/alpha crystallin family protein [Bifidobacterium callimiconis]|uniref:Molecular chaperone Hsp20 n=1 Tax=Bifidobacterium callimiconis TaxID=2306973 RepID=A0A430F7V5_9BIFI|nr:Hsp20/alpha crystallin family protein [Bifidobacterium callimiconis]MBT1178093.1 Hsp20/alpha crystallin family protein [Bifidobacterium callimiconis]RSX49005.1 molecular chaperone Hsp20 [Bifidobacterium callimiconis]